MNDMSLAAAPVHRIAEARQAPALPTGSDHPNRAQPCFFSRLACRFSFRLFDAGFLAGFPLLSLFATNITLQPGLSQFIGRFSRSIHESPLASSTHDRLVPSWDSLRCSITRYHEFAALLVAQSDHVRV